MQKMKRNEKETSVEAAEKKIYVRPRLERKRSLVRATLFSGSSPAIVGGSVP
ncbi:MAG: hypothetical protein ACJAYU_003254 [Bradymonadia bacterium]|jgi:hypothetical protein